MLGKLHSIERALATMSAAALWLLAPATVRGQSEPASPCCGIVRIDLTNSIITAREMATGYTFRVEVKSKKLLSTLKVGDKVWANFAVKRVRLGALGDSLWCAILEAPAASATRKAANP